MPYVKPQVKDIEFFQLDKENGRALMIYIAHTDKVPKINKNVNNFLKKKKSFFILLQTLNIMKILRKKKEEETTKEPTNQPFIQFIHI